MSEIEFGANLRFYYIIQIIYKRIYEYFNMKHITFLYKCLDSLNIL